MSFARDFPGPRGAGPRALTALVALLGALTLGAPPAAAQTLGGTPLPARGADTARVEIVEVSDFECPYCARVAPTLQELERTYGPDLRFVFLHQPLGFHKRATPAAIAATAAGLQGRFWELHDALFAHQKALGDDDIRGYAAAAGLDLRAFDQDLGDPALAAWVNANKRVASAAGARGTPTFFINGVKLAGAQPVEAFKRLIDAELDQSKAAGRQGAEWRAERTRLNDPLLHSFLYGSQLPEGLTADQIPSLGGPRLAIDAWRVAVTPADAARGGSADSAPVTMVVFADLECPFCRRAHETVEKVRAKYGDRLRYVFKHRPLSFHTRALPAARAALCAQQQGRFWELHDLIYTQYETLTDDVLARFAREAGVTLGAKGADWRACLASDAVTQRLAADAALARSVGARGTPTFFINGRKLAGAQPLEEFELLIDEELARAQTFRDAGVPAAELYAALTGKAQVKQALGAETFELDMNGTPLLGPKDAPIVLTVFADFECPYCAKIRPALDAVRQRFGDRVAIAFKHFPLSFHKHARPAARAAICAREQDGFDAFHDALFDRQVDLGPSLYAQLANELELDFNRYDACVKSTRPDLKIDADMEEGRAVGLRGTPTLLINGRMYDSQFGGWSAEAIGDTVAELLGDKTAAAPPAQPPTGQGTAPAGR